MDKTQFLMTLYDALEGLPGNVKADIMSHYQEIFRSGMAKGRTEEEIAQELGDPVTVAYAEKSRMGFIQSRPRKASFLGFCMKGLGLLFFNLVVVLGPALGGLGLLIGLWGAAIGLSVSGIAILGGAFFTFRFPFGLFAHGQLSFLTVISASVFSLALGLLLGMGCLAMTRWSFKALGRYIHWNLRILFGRQGS
jgi:uncharacterized membrane protein